MDKSVMEMYEEIALLEVEISSFSGGGYKVRYDFDRNLISWNDGYMWNNNFMKSLTAPKLALIRDRLPETGMIEWMIGYNAGNLDKYGKATANPSSWKPRNGDCRSMCCVPIPLPRSSTPWRIC